MAGLVLCYERATHLEGRDELIVFDSGLLSRLALGSFRRFCNVLSPSSQYGRLLSGSERGGEKKYSPQLWSDSRDVRRILWDGRWYLIEDI